MRRRFTFVGVTLAVGAWSWATFAQDQLKPLDANKARTDYSFPIHAGEMPFRFQVQVNTRGETTGILVFRGNEPRPFQTITSCDQNHSFSLTEYDEKRELLQHADLNFDGFEDLELLREFDAHNGSSVYCIYVWEPKQQRFRHEPEIPDVNPVAEPQSRTIFVHQDWQGGLYNDSRYRWNSGKLELVEQSGRVYGSKDPDCATTDFCSRLINGKMVQTAEKKSGCGGAPDEPLVCPAAPRRNPLRRVPLRK